MSSPEKRARDKARYAADPELYKRRSKAYRAKRPRYNAYIDQRQAAKRRGVEFNLTFEEWLEWWGDDIKLRGVKRNCLQMCRYDDVGPYELGNIYKATQDENHNHCRSKE